MSEKVGLPVNAVTASFNTTAGQMKEMHQRKKIHRSRSDMREKDKPSTQNYIGGDVNVLMSTQTILSLQLRLKVFDVCLRVHAAAHNQKLLHYEIKTRTVRVHRV